VKIPYNTFQQYAPVHYSGGGDAGLDASTAQMSERDWDALSGREQYETLMSGAGGTIGTHFDPRAGAEDTARFRSQFGNAPWDNRASGRAADEYGSHILYGYGNLPVNSDASFNEWALDPSRVLRDEDGRWMVESDNISGDWQERNQHNRSSTFDRKIWQTALMMAAAAGGGYLAGPTSAGTGAGAGAGAGGMDAVTAAEWWGGSGAATNPSAGLFGSAGGSAGGAGLAGLGEGAPGWAAEGGSVPGGASSAQGGGLLDQAGNYARQAGNWAMNNPLRALSLANTGAGLLRGGGSNAGGSGASGGGGKSGGGAGIGGAPAKTERPQWNPNPFLQAQLQRGGYL
jgi:hypothetical protein